MTQNKNYFIRQSEVQGCKTIVFADVISSSCIFYIKINKHKIGAEIIIPCKGTIRVDNLKQLGDNIKTAKWVFNKHGYIKNLFQDGI
jgi:hypothetical protein